MLDWSQAEKYYDLNNSAGFTMAILEVEKMLRHVLHNKRYPGKNIDEKVFWAKKILSAPQTFTNARAITLNVLKLEYPKIIAKPQTEEILKSYFAAVTELDTADSAKIRKLRFSYKTNRLKKVATKVFTVILTSIIVLTLVVFFLNKTEMGARIIEGLIDFANIVAFKALPVFLIAVTLLAIGLGLALRKHKKSPSLSIAETQLPRTEEKSHHV